MNSKKRKEHLINLLYFFSITICIYVSFRYIFPVIMPLIIAYAIAFFVQRPARMIEKKIGINCKILAVIFVGLSYIFIVLLVIWLGSLLLAQASELFSKIPDIYSDNIEPYLLKLSQWIDKTFELSGNIGSSGVILSDYMPTILSGISSAMLNLLSSVASTLPSFFISFGITFIATFLIAYDYENIMKYLMNIFKGKKQNKILSIKSGVVAGIFRLLRAYISIFAIDFCILFMGFTIFKIEYAAIIALVIAFADMIPLFGSGIIMLPWIFIQIISSNIAVAISLAILFAIMSVTRSIVEPRLIGRQIGMHPGATRGGMDIGMQLFGFLGLLLLPFILMMASEVVRFRNQGEYEIS